MIKIIDAQFVATAVDAKGLPTKVMPEVAWVGRSNVGKSSMINTLVNRRKLMRVSNTPGRTRTLNFIDVTVEENKVRRQIRFADLPGYGFARVSKNERASWQGMASGYLEKRESLKVIVSILDAEIGPTKDDEQTLEYLTTMEAKILVVATKIDRLSKSKRIPRLKDIAIKTGLPREAVLPFSSTDGTGVEEVWEMLLGVVG